MSRRDKAILFVIAAIVAAAPAHALMEFFGSDPMPFSSGWPEGLAGLVNHDGRFAGAVGPIADWHTYHSGDTDASNAFLKKVAALKDATLRVVIQRGNYAIAMNRFDGSDRTNEADWTMWIGESYPGRPDASKFEGRKPRVEIRINPGGQIDLKKLDVPLGLVVEAGPEFKDFEKRHRARQAEKDCKR